MGSFLQAYLSPWLPSNPGLLQAVILVAHYGSLRLVLRRGMHSVLRIKFSDKLRLASFSHSLFLIAPGHTFPRIL